MDLTCEPALEVSQSMIFHIKNVPKALVKGLRSRNTVPSNYPKCSRVPTNRPQISTSDPSIRSQIRSQSQISISYLSTRSQYPISVPNPSIRSQYQISVSDLSITSHCQIPSSDLSARSHIRSQYQILVSDLSIRSQYPISVSDLSI